MCQRRAQITIETAVIYSNFPPNIAGSNPVITTDVMNEYLQGETNIFKKANYDHFNKRHALRCIPLSCTGIKPSLVRFSSLFSQSTTVSIFARHAGGSRFPKTYY